jgi:hypothetical protein
MWVIKMKIQKVGVMAGGPVDCQMGANFLASKGLRPKITLLHPQQKIY